MAGPFPSNKLTVPDATTRTGLRVHLDPAEEESCLASTHPSVCGNSALLNQLDGFSLNPRIMVCFSDTIDLTTVKAGISLVPLAAPFTPVSLNQITADPSQHCVYGKPETVLNQRSPYLLLVTDRVQDVSGHGVADDGNFQTCLHSSELYCKELAAAYSKVPHLPSNVVSGSLFTTLSATSWLAEVRASMNSYTGFAVPAGFPYVFKLSELKTVAWQPDTTKAPAQMLPLSVLGGVDRVAFGLFFSPNYLNANGSITTETTHPVPVPNLFGGLTFGMVPVSFHVFIPAGEAPEGGWPITIYGHGLSDNQFGAPTYIASTLARKGIATVAMEITGHGFGPQSTVQVTDKFGFTTTEATPGRGIQLPSSSQIGPQDGCILPGALAIRDCGRQTAIDLFALVKAIRDTEGLGLGLNADRISYVGQSFGALYGSLFHAVEPNVHAAVINAGGGTEVDIARLSLTGRPLSAGYLASISPALLNLGANAAPEAYFGHTPNLGYYNDNYVFRDQQPPLANTVFEATALQAAFEAADWIGMIGDPLAYAPHFKAAPLPGVPAKATLFQFGLGDLEVPNPTESALVRAAAAQDTAWFFRFDWAVSGPGYSLAGIMSQNTPGLPILPHRILSNETIFDNPWEASIAHAEQQQVADFVLSGGQQISDPNASLKGAFAGTTFFEPFLRVPASILDRLNFVQIPQ